MAWKDLGGGVLHIHYESPDELAPARQRELLRRVEERSAAGEATVLFFEVGPQVRSVELEVPAFWLDVVSRRELRLRGMAICSGSVAVRAAAKGFGLANRVRGLPTAVEAFEDRSRALAWARGLLSAKPDPR